MALRFVEMDLLSSPAQFIAHQCNCTSRVAKGLAKDIFTRFPHADTYGTGSTRVPGTIHVAGNAGERPVINLHAQVGAGGASRRKGDNQEERLLLFRECLRRVRDIEGLVSVAFPYKVGCGMAGGKWEEYEAELRGFAENLPNVDVAVCRLGAPDEKGKERATKRIRI